jgi:hypothetical protein
MTRSNRPLNRLLLLVLGVVALAAAAALALPLLPGTLAGVRMPQLTLGRPGQLALQLMVVGCVVVIALAIAWIVTRGRGRTVSAIGGERADGVTVDVRVVEQLLRDALDGDPDLLGTSVTGFRVRGRSVLRVRLSARRGAELRRLLDALGRAVADLDVALGVELPILVHVTSGLRASIAHEQRVA